MKKIAVIFLFFGMFANAQNNFQQGVITKSNGEKISALIGLYSWKKFPEKIDYRFQADSEVKYIESSEIDSLVINDGPIYFKRVIKIDISSDRTSEISNSYAPFFEEQTIFLKVLVQGSASLYASLTNDRRIYFYKTQSHNLEQLVYKKYFVDESETKIGTNNTYLNQLHENVSCQTKNRSSVRYEATSLTNYFVAFNKCMGVDYDVSNEKSKLGYSLKVIAGADYTNLTVKNYDRWRDNELDFDGEVSPRIGLEFEVHIPGKNKNSLSGFLQVFYKQYSVNQEIKSVDFDIDFKGIDITPGFRYNINLKNEQRVFIDLGLDINLTLSETASSEAFSEGDRYALFESNNLSGSFGAGYSKNRFNVFLRYYLPVSYEGGYYQSIYGGLGTKVQKFESKMQSISLLLAYDLF